MNRAQLQTVSDSRSLWNQAPSPGWTMHEMEALRLALMKYGCGYWGLISRHFPQKTQGQLNLQTQRMFGQQSLAEFFRLHLDPKPFFEINSKRMGVTRKQGFIINAGDKLTPKLKKEKIKENKKLEISQEEVDKIRVPFIREKVQQATEESAAMLLNRLIHIYKAIHLMQQTLDKQEDTLKLKNQRFDLDNMTQADRQSLLDKQHRERKQNRLARAKKLREEEDKMLAANKDSSQSMEVDEEEKLKPLDKDLPSKKRPKPSPSAKPVDPPAAKRPRI